MGQLVYPTWTALSPLGEGSRHGRDGPGESPRQAGQVFRRGMVDVRHVRIRAPVSHKLDEEWGDAHAVGEGCAATSEAVPREHRRVHTDLVKAILCLMSDARLGLRLMSRHSPMRMSIARGCDRELAPHRSETQMPQSHDAPVDLELFSCTDSGTYSKPTNRSCK
jgi:hypothetical protein